MKNLQWKTMKNVQWKTMQNLQGIYNEKQCKICNEKQCLHDAHRELDISLITLLARNYWVPPIKKIIAGSLLSPVPPLHFFLNWAKPPVTLTPFYFLRVKFIRSNYGWAKRTKFLLAVIYGSPWQHSNGSKTLKKNQKKWK